MWSFMWYPQTGLSNTELYYHVEVYLLNWTRKENQCNIRPLTPFSLWRGSWLSLFTKINTESEISGWLVGWYGFSSHLFWIVVLLARVRFTSLTLPPRIYLLIANQGIFNTQSLFSHYVNPILVHSLENSQTLKIK